MAQWRGKGGVKLFGTWGEFSPGWTMSSGDSSLDSVVKSITRLNGLKNYELDIINVGAAVCREETLIKLCFGDFHVINLFNIRIICDFHFTR